MNNIILGSGIIGLCAKLIFGPSWKIIPFAKSRFFSYNPALDDNFIIADERTNDFFGNLNLDALQTKLYRRSWSIDGLLYKEFDKTIYAKWLDKLFGYDHPTHAEVYLNKNEFSIYNLRINELYSSLLNSMLPELKQEASIGKITEIGDHYIIRNNIKEDYDNIISTIPLNILYELMNIKIKLPSKTIQYLHVATDALNFEGSNQSLVVDNIFSFYKVTALVPGRYMFYCHEDIPNPGIYLMPIIQGNFDILDGTSIEHSLPLGPNPKLEWLEKYNIHCVGSYAQWDWCMDVSSCILRLLKMAQQNFKLRTYVGIKE